MLSSYGAEKGGDKMVLIFGGVYQGKLAYAKEHYGNREIINQIDHWILSLIESDEDVLEKVEELIAAYPDAVIICNDISCGVVPTSALHRKWRDETGRAMSLLAAHSEEVIRMFCGIPTKLK